MNSEKSVQKSIASIEGWLAHYLVHKGEPCQRKPSNPTLWSGCSMFVSRRWLLSKIESHHVVNVVFSSLSPLSLPVYPFPPPFSHALRYWMEQRMNLGSSSWVRQLSIDCVRSAQSFMPLYACETVRTKTHNPAQQGHSPWKINVGQSPWKHCGGELGVFCLHEEQYC